MNPGGSLEPVRPFSSVLGPGDVFWSIRKSWAGITVCALAGLALGAAYVRVFPDTYTSQAVLRFNPPQVADRYVHVNDSLQAEQRIFGQVQTLTSSVTARKLIESLSLYPERRRFQTIEDLVPVFQRNLVIQRATQPGTDNRRVIPSLRISFGYSDPEVARRVVGQLVEAAYEINRRYRGDQSVGTSEFLKNQVELTEEKLSELEEQMGQMGMGDRVAGDHNWALSIQQLYNVEHRLGHVQASLRTLQRDRDDRIAEVQELESRLRRVNSLITRKTEPPSYAAFALVGEMHRREARLKALLQRYNPNTPDVEAARAELEEATAQVESQYEVDVESARLRMRRELGGRVDLLRADVAALESTIQRQQSEELSLSRRAEVLRAQTKPAQQDDVEYLHVQREYDVLKDFHQALLRKQQESLVATDLERLGRGEVIELIEPPSAPAGASTPMWPWKLALGFVLGALTGAFSAFFRLIFDPPVIRESHLQFWPSLPLLAEIPAAPQLALAGATSGGERRIRIRFKRSSSLFALVLCAAAVSGTGCSADRFKTKEHWIRSARSFEAKGNPRNAMLAWRRALALDPRLAEAHSHLANLEFSAGEIERAYSHLIRAAELSPNDLMLQIRLADLTAQIYFADPGRSRGTLLQLDDIAARLASRWPNRPEGYFHQSMVLVERHRSQEACDLLRTALTRLPGSPSLVTQLASFEYAGGNRQEAIALLTGLTAQGTSYLPAYDLLYLQLMQNRQPEAAGDVLRAKWTAHGDLDSGLQYAAHLYTAGGDRAVEPVLDEIGVRHSSQPDAYARLGDFWLHRAENERAWRYYQKGLARFPGARSTYIGRLAEMYVAADDRQAAMSLIQSELQARPKDDSLLAWRASLRLRSGQKQERTTARMDLELILSRMPNSAFVRYHLGRAYFDEGDIARAERHFERCVHLDPNYAPGWLALAETQAGRGQFGAARRQVDSLLTRAPGHTTALLLKARLQAAQGEVSAAEATLDRLAASPIPGERLLLERASLRLLNGDAAGALRVLLPALEANPGSRPLLIGTAQAEAAAGDAERALQRLSRRGDHPELKEAYAAIALQSGRYPQAVETYTGLLRAQPDSPRLNLALADSLALSGRLNEASPLYRKVQQAEPEKLRPWLNHASVLASAGDFAGAQQAYSRALAIDGNNPFVLNNLAYLQARSGLQLAYALQLAQQADRLMPGTREITDTLVYVQLRMGMKEQALTTLERLTVATPPKERAALAAVRSNLATGNLEAAARVLEVSRDQRIRKLTENRS